MNLYDRYIDKIVLEKDLPNQIDFGRYCIIDQEGGFKDITYSNFPTNRAISQELLLEKNKSIQEIFIDISIDIDKAGSNNFNVIPLIRRIKNKLGLNDFEKLLYQKVFHLEEIFRVPHYLLEREIEKVNVSRAKRIPSKSYQYLASHTEDWIHKSIVSFKPSRILNEELELNFDIYENQLTVAFLERCLVYLNSRMKEIQDIKSFLSEYEKLLKNRDDQKGWHKKIIRNLRLIGAVYEDDHFHGKSKDGSTLTETEETLNQINKRLLLLRKSDLFDLVNKRATQSISLRNTNVLVNHKHYRYVKSLWIELENVKPEKSDSEKIKFEQDVFKGLRAYGKSLFIYILKNNLEYELNGNYKNLSGQHLLLSKVNFIETDKGTFLLTIGNYQIKIVIIGNEPNVDDNLFSILKSKNTFVLYFAEQTIIDNSKLIQINPLDPDSIERLGSLVKKFLLMAYLDNIFNEHKFKHLLKDYIKYIPTEFIDFISYSYKFHSFPITKLSLEEVKKEIERDSVFRSKSRPDQDNILKAISDLIEEIELNAIRLKEDFLNCFNCGQKLQSYQIEKLNYLKCKLCKCLIDSSNSEKIILKIDDSRYNLLADNEFGMDVLIFNRTEL
ncbi:MAG: hypothetical protein CUR34_07620 [Sediminibacterium sp.]|nr:MAG: hypothetical protein CUR34_07620 [Sediminibacterium sp.] [Sediminibacterium sp. FEMGT703S]